MHSSTPSRCRFIYYHCFHHNVVYLDKKCHIGCQTIYQSWWTRKSAHYGPHSKDGEGNIFSLCVSPHRREGVTPVCRWGVPHPSWQGVLPCFSTGRGYPIGTGWVYPSSELDGGTPPPPHWDWMGVPPIGTGWSTRRAVCLLRSRRRTFFFLQSFGIIHIYCYFLIP